MFFKKKFSINPKISIMKIFIALFIIIVIGVVISLYFFQNNNSFTNKFIIKHKNMESFLNTIWQVQASIVIITTALLSILISVNKEEEYGFKIIDFMIIKRILFLNYYEKLLLSLLLILVEYCFVAFAIIEASVFILFISTIIIVHLVYKSIKYIFFEDAVKQEIEDYILYLTEKMIEKENIQA